MPNLYATPTEIKAAMPDGIRLTTTKYDAAFLYHADTVSRLVENLTHRRFHPELATRYFWGSGGTSLRVGHLIAITSVSISEDDGETYTALAASDYFTSVEGDVNAPGSYTHLHISTLSDDWSVWVRGEKSVKIVGVWGYTDSRADCWEDSTDEVENNPLAADGTALTVNDAAGPSLWGVAPRFQPGQLARFGSEFFEITESNGTTGLTIVRARNGTTAAEQAQNVQIDLWRPPAPVKQAVITQIVRGFMRALQGYGDGRANAETSQTIWVRSLDPDVITNLAAYVDPVHA